MHIYTEHLQKKKKYNTKKKKVKTQFARRVSNQSGKESENLIYGSK